MADDEEKIVILERKEYIKKQFEEACSNPNRHFANIAQSKETNEDEAFLHYTLHGGAEDFARRHAIKDVVEKKENCGRDQP